MLHVDTPNRDSLACDLMEPVRPQIDAYVLDWITRQPLHRGWFLEQRDGNCRMMAMLAKKLSQTATTWGRAVAPLAEWIAQTLWDSVRKSANDTKAVPTRLTQNRKRAAKGSMPQTADARRGMAHQNICADCGKPIRKYSKHCTDCSLRNSTLALVQGAKLGRTLSHTEQAQARRSESKRRHDQLHRRWDPQGQPAWLTEEVYKHQIQPRLSTLTLSALASALGVSIPYASDIRRGRRRPHQRHWLSLANLIGREQFVGKKEVRPPGGREIPQSKHRTSSSTYRLSS